MSRLTVVRRLAAVTALLAVFCLALPAAAAPGAHRQSARAHVAHASGLVDQFIAWIGTLLPAPSQTSRTEKAGTAVPVLISPDGSASLAPPPNNTDKSGTIDPNG